ncbi:nucleoside 2-deoxyribosyltransferase domain-containing protein [Catellatospora sp. KI3]|uniref:nucleoside 2-deoxyribosyltransferase domain-containing protein n=1 Tax=Catellatospora sp. KI3 TaxID=3041620 RepID=UPI0024828473|nr:nucleoside 2-deoxyribosyltransferase domain-containing protein [Catellatospora sp. KI3]MDI1466312.1 nucleoside 2-deoxyribosyltransferase domain-containing protein [Catellatospora sp. KI3]
MNTIAVYAGEQPPPTWQASVFLAGPMPRDPDAASWRPDALALLTAAWRHPGTLVVFVPEPRDRAHPPVGYVSQVWEERWMAVVDVILFWVPRDLVRLPGLTTNLEFGRNEGSGRAVLGLPPEAVKVHYLRRSAEANGVPVRDNLPATVEAALAVVGAGASRGGADRDVPLLVWRTAEFIRWRAALDAELVSVRVLWAWSPAPHFALRAWAARVEVRRAEELTTELLIHTPNDARALAGHAP